MSDTLALISNDLLGEGFDFDWEGTPSCPVLYHYTAQGTVIGVDDETVCLYLDMGRDESPFEITSIRHHGDRVTITRLVTVLSLTELGGDLKFVLNSGLAAIAAAR